MAKQQRYSPEVKERALRALRNQRASYNTEWAAFSSIASTIGCTVETFGLIKTKDSSQYSRIFRRSPKPGGH